ncbi:hypothetical protein HGA88_00080 [Candidatus Roizmanbacteria bacterium]|nr:hypothetical protein [Candidatus Roizmanbacteria bacterium]
MNIIPALLVKTKEELQKQITTVSPYFSTVQIDIADGTFVPNKTLSIQNVLETCSLSPKGIVFDFHLMVVDYRKALQELKIFSPLISIGNIFLHSKLAPPLEQLKFECNNLTIGLAINPEEQIDDLAVQYTLSSIPFLQIMTVNPGFQGGSFLSDSLYKIEQLKKHDYRSPIYVDGGINDRTISQIMQKKYRPNYLCVGSYLSNAGDELEARIAQLHLKMKTGSATPASEKQ